MFVKCRASTVRSLTRRSGRETGIGRQTNASISVKKPAFTPIATPTAAMAIQANPGLRRSMRKPYATSCQSCSIRGNAEGIRIRPIHVDLIRASASRAVRLVA
jgi:hypothetical protein